jgi:hypothetical protein
MPALGMAISALTRLGDREGARRMSAIPQALLCDGLTAPESLAA